MKSIKYRKGYKYQLAETYTTTVGIIPQYDIVTEYIILRRNGQLTILKGYAWDGPSGPTIDTPTFMRGSLIHDALYQLIRWGLLSKDFRRQADIELVTACEEDGMCWLRRKYVFDGVRKFAGFAADPSARKEIITAP